MRLLVMSDSHGDAFSCEQALRRHPDCGYLIHLGDGEEDIDRVNTVFLNRRIARVKGNCSRYSPLSAEQILDVEDCRILICHGHTRNVKVTLDLLENAAALENCRLALYGHTHVQKITRLPELDLTLFNPGSIRMGQYGIVTVDKSGIICEKMSLL